MSVYVVPAPAWTKKGLKHLDSRLCGSDEISPTETCPESALERARMLLRDGVGNSHSVEAIKCGFRPPVLPTEL